MTTQAQVPVVSKEDQPQGVEQSTEETLTSLVSPAVIDLASKASQTLDDLAPMMSVKMDYKRFEDEGESCRGIFLGFGQKPNAAGKMLEFATWLEKGGKTFYHSGVILVGDMKRENIKPGTAIEITFVGNKKVGKGSGTAKDFRVMILGQRLA